MSRTASTSALITDAVVGGAGAGPDERLFLRRTGVGADPDERLLLRHLGRPMSTPVSSARCKASRASSIAARSSALSAPEAPAR
ncbi:hypothetical protein [Hyphomonas sp.]|uniref:hypothetical protein n=1 Tax=Hyphomonas sp. TaxID=87 RepID=UPI003341FB02